MIGVNMGWQGQDVEARPARHLVFGAQSKRLDVLRLRTIV